MLLILLPPRDMMLIGKRGFLQAMAFPRAITDKQGLLGPEGAQGKTPKQRGNSFMSMLLKLKRSNVKQLTNVER